MKKSVLHKLLLAIASFILSGCNPIPSHTKCNLPFLDVNSEIIAIEKIGTWGVYQNYCPKPIERVFEVERNFGVIKFEWWGSPHRLYLSVKGSEKDFSELSINNSVVILEKVDIDSGWLSQYSHRVTFPNNDFTKPILPNIKFELLVKNGDGDKIDSIEMSYSTRICTCSSIDSI